MILFHKLNQNFLTKAPVVDKISNFTNDTYFKSDLIDILEENMPFSFNSVSCRTIRYIYILILVFNKSYPSLMYSSS